MTNLLLGGVTKLASALLAKKLNGKVPDEVKDVVVGALSDIDPNEIQNDPELRTMASEFSESYLAYYGSFEQLPPKVQMIRALQRPLLTVLFSLAYVTIITIAMVMGQITGTYAIAAIGGPVLTIVGFLFGERSALKTPTVPNK